MGAYRIGMLPVFLFKESQNYRIHPLLYTVEIFGPPSNHLAARYTTVAPSKMLMSFDRC